MKKLTAQTKILDSIVIVKWQNQHIYSRIVGENGYFKKAKVILSILINNRERN
jgi:hypothetical protein